MKITFSKHERIKSRIVLDEVYKNGELIKHFPYRLKYLSYKFEDEAKVKIVVSIPKRNVKKAVDRNRLRRQIKEAYRLNKSDLVTHFKEKEGGLALFLIYSGKENQPYDFLEKNLKVVLQQLIKKV